jgi:hypothetical protein
MKETEWVKSILERINKELSRTDKSLAVYAGKDLPYACEIRQYDDERKPEYSTMKYQTDILVIENKSQKMWIPRVVIEAKLGRITTHDAITYSQKSATHRHVHPYLRYGILIGNRGHHPLPGRLFRHGTHFDFMLSWKGTEPTKKEFSELTWLLDQETRASRQLEEIIFNSRSHKREKFVCLHKPLNLR